MAILKLKKKSFELATLFNSIIDKTRTDKRVIIFKNVKCGDILGINDVTVQKFSNYINISGVVYC